MKKNIFALTIFCSLAFFCLTSAEAFRSFTERNCKMDREPELIFLSSYGKLEYKYKTSDFMKNFSDKTKNSKHKVLGLTVPNPTLEVNIITTINDNPFENDVCVVPDKVEVFFGFVDPVIYISKDIKYKTCTKTLVLRHEQAHQQINILALNYFLPQMKKLIRQKISELKPVVVQRKLQNKAVQEMNEIVMKRM